MMYIGKVYHGVPLEAREQLCETGSFLPFVSEFQGSNSCCQGVWQLLNQLSIFPSLLLTVYHILSHIYIYIIIYNHQAIKQVAS